MDKPTLHFITGNEYPIWVDQHRNAWSQYAEVRTWTWTELEAEIGQPFIDFCNLVPELRYRANWARHWLMLHHGGGYADWDTEPMSNPFRLEVWEDNFVIAPHPQMIPYVDNCFMYVARPGHPVAREIFDEVDFSQLTSKQITILTANNPDRVRLPLPWNRNRDTGDAIIQHYYTGASLDAQEMDWLIPRVRGRVVTEAGAGLRSIEFNQVCDLTSVEHQPMFADRVKRGGCHVILEPDLNKYPNAVAMSSANSEVVLIDGRRRMSCLNALATWQFPHTVYLHDSNRDKYSLPDDWRIIDECPTSKRGLIAITRR